MIDLLDRLSVKHLLACRKCKSTPIWYRPGKEDYWQDDDGAEHDLSAYCPICGTENYLTTVAYDCGAYEQWNGKMIKDETP